MLTPDVTDIAGNLSSALPIASSRPYVRELTGKEVAHAPLGVVHRTPRETAADEADMSPAPHKLYFERRIIARYYADLIEYIRREKWIVDCAEKERRNSHSWQIVVVECVAEAMDWGCHGVVELPERPDAVQSSGVEEIRMPDELLPCLGDERSEEKPLVDMREATREIPTPAGEIEWHGHSDRTTYRCRNLITGSFTEPLEQNVPAERDAGQTDGHVRVFGDDTSEGEIEVGRLAGVIESARAIHFASAAAKDHQISAPAAARRFGEQIRDVVRVDSALEAMQEHEVGCRGRSASWSIETAKLEHVVVWCRPLLDAYRRLQATTRQPPPHRAQM